MDKSEKDAPGHDPGQGISIKVKVFIGLFIFILFFIANVITGHSAWTRVPLAILAVFLIYNAWFKKSK